MAISFDLDVPLAPGCDDGGVESKLLFVQPQEPKHGGNKLLPVFINVELRGSDPPKSVEVPQPHVGSTQREAGHEAATVLSGKNFSGVSSEVEPCFGRHIGQWVALEFSRYENLPSVVFRIRAGARIVHKANIQLAVGRGALQRPVRLCQRSPTSLRGWLVLGRPA
jgi:hypothetical protein